MEDLELQLRDYIRVIDRMRKQLDAYRISLVDLLYVIPKKPASIPIALAKKRSPRPPKTVEDLHAFHPTKG